MRRFLARFGAWLLARLGEPTTYAGFALMGIAVKQKIPDDWMAFISWVGPFVAGGLIAASQGGSLPPDPPKE